MSDFLSVVITRSLSASGPVEGRRDHSDERTYGDVPILGAEEPPRVGESDNKPRTHFVLVLLQDSSQTRCWRLAAARLVMREDTPCGEYEYGGWWHVLT